MKDIVDELRTAANMVAHADEAMAALLDNAAAEIERLRGSPIVLDKSPRQQVAVSAANVLRWGTYLRDEIDG